MPTIDQDLGLQRRTLKASVGEPNDVEHCRAG
jgi:hypothetical protein